MKIWFLTKMIALCNYALKFSDEEDCEDVNEMVKMKNYFIKEKAKLSVR